MDSAAASWLDPQPAASAYALPAHCYVGEPAAARDRAAVFARSWQLVAHAAQVSAPGDHAVSEIASVPLLIVRGDDGKLRALHNVCRHRAGPLALCDGRAARALACKYHGWTYELDGRLRGAPGMGEASDFDVSEIRLPQARIAEWQGLVFAALGDAPEFANVVAAVDARVVDLTFDRRVSYEAACNWKVYVDNYLEGYHVARVHPGLNAVLDTNSYATALARWSSLQSSPIAADPGQRALYYWLWPNTMLNLLSGRLQTNRVVPLATDRCRIAFDYYYAAGASAAARAADLELSDDVQREDIAICEAVQRGLASGSYAAGRLNPAQESGVWHFHELLRRAYREQHPAEKPR